MFIAGTCCAVSCKPAVRVAVKRRIKLRQVRNFLDDNAS